MTKPANQPLNVKMGKQEADAMFRRKDRRQIIALRNKDAPPASDVDVDDWSQAAVDAVREFDGLSNPPEISPIP